MHHHGSWLYCTLLAVTLAVGRSQSERAVGVESEGPPAPFDDADPINWTDGG